MSVARAAFAHDGLVLRPGRVAAGRRERGPRGRRPRARPAALLAAARQTAASLGDAESGALVELVWSGLLAERGELIEAERVAATALERFPGAIGYGSSLRLNRARMLRRAARWSAALDVLGELERHVAAHADALGPARPTATVPACGASVPRSGWSWGVFDEALGCLAEEERFAERSGRAEDAA